MLTGEALFPSLLLYIRTEMKANAFLGLMGDGMNHMRLNRWGFHSDFRLDFTQPRRTKWFIPLQLLFFFSPFFVTEFHNTHAQGHLDRVKLIWYLSPMRAAKVQASLRIRAVSPEPPLLAHTSSESRGTFRQKARSLAPLNGWACAVKVCHDGMLEDTNSLDGAHLVLYGYSELDEETR